MRRRTWACRSSARLVVGAPLELEASAKSNTIHAGGGSYYTRRAYDLQGGAVHERELQIWHEYQRHARELDTRFSPAGQHPILSLLQSHGRTRGLVYGAYGEGSADVHALIAKAAEARAAILWREAGARTASEMRAFLIGA